MIRSVIRSVMPTTVPDRRFRGDLPDAGSSRLGEGDGVLLIGHGTRDPVGTSQFFELGERLSSRLAPIPVEACLLELQPPTIPEGWQRLIDRGVVRVHAAPLLLFAAGHAKSDIPDELAKCLSGTSDVRRDQSRPLSRCPELIALTLRRLDEALARSEADPSRTAVVMVGRGSHDPCAQADMRVYTQCIGWRRPVRRIETAFYAMAKPKLPDVIDCVASDPAISDVIVQPHILFEGAIHQSILDHVRAAGERNPGCRFWCAGYLGPEAEVVDSLIRRVNQIRHDSLAAR